MVKGQVAHIGLGCLGVGVVMSVQGAKPSPGRGQAREGKGCAVPPASSRGTSCRALDVMEGPPKQKVAT